MVDVKHVSHCKNSKALLQPELTWKGFPIYYPTAFNSVLMVDKLSMGHSWHPHETEFWGGSTDMEPRLPSRRLWGVRHSGSQRITCMDEHGGRGNVNMPEERRYHCQ